LLNFVIMAGGKGERFWPKSRMELPKQLLNLTGNGTMIQETVWRLKKIAQPSQIYIVTGGMYVAKIAEQLPELPPENIIVEPEGRNTAPCIGLASIIIEKKDPGGVMAVLAADHVIQKPDLFCELLLQGSEVARETGGIVTLGIQPDRPETGYGYIKMGPQASGADNLFRVERFTEKPNLETAHDFLASGKYLWNSGMFIWKVATIRRAIADFMPDLHQGLETIRAAIGTDQYPEILAEQYSKFEKISIDYGVMERAPLVYVLPADIGWDDVGSWTALERLRAQDANGNVLPNENIVAIDLQNCIFETSGDKLVAAIGLSDIVYVETGDAVLICPKNRVQDVKKVLEKVDKTKQ
jgi:mannose-1-phosphate guanylyltransferase